MCMLLFENLVRILFIHDHYHQTRTKTEEQKQREGTDLPFHPLANIALPGPSPLKSIGRSMKIEHSLLYVIHTGQNERTILENRLIQRLSSDDDESGL